LQYKETDFPAEMSDIIQLLPDSVANQIAAGEVVQRPASAVKELLENATDAGATNIKLITKEAGKTLMQVMDNGCGMSETDARMCFERHATSKIRKADDLFSIRTMGFRGEAMASIAAIAQVEMKTRRIGDEVGTLIEIEGSEVKRQEPFQCTEGTSIAIKNLFYNVPARRNFLKSNQVELRNIIEEFHRVALAHPEIAFSLYHNDNELFRLDNGSFKQRIMGLFGNNYNERIVPVDEVTHIVKISGFIGKPEFAKKLRGEQYFFVNKRFIKSTYLNHAVQAAFEDFIPDGAFPSYFLMLDLDPKTIDINIHPTKTEIKFEDEKSIYAIIRSAVRQALGKFHLTPTLDFEQEESFTLPLSYQNKDIVHPSIKVNPNFNPFESEKSVHNNTSKPREERNIKNWGNLYEGTRPEGVNNEKEFISQSPAEIEQTKILISGNQEIFQKLYHQLQKRYILTTIKSGLVIIDQQKAHERILFEKYFTALEKQKKISQQMLFPVTLNFSGTDAALLKELIVDIQSLGFDINEFGQNDFVVNGIPPEIKESEIQFILEGILEQFRMGGNTLKQEKKEILALSMARKVAINPGRMLSHDEMQELTDQLFACNEPYFSPSGKPTFITMSIDELERRFQK
jgi:DNA mismatch repair protein MutL